MQSLMLSTVPGILEELLYLKGRLQFPKDIISDRNAQSRCKYAVNLFCQRYSDNGCEVLSNTETLLKAIHSRIQSKLETAIQQKANDGGFASSESWCELRHYLGRLHSYRRAAEIIVATSQHWPELFQDFTITPLPSSAPLPRPLPKTGLTAYDIICNMTNDEETRARCLSQAEDMQKFGLDELVAVQLGRTNFQPFVHAEILIHSFLLNRNISLPNQYWNSQKYIGSSKPTCRLCSYYFNIHSDQVSVRSSHFNLYSNWRLPVVPSSLGAIDGKQKTLDILQRITENVCNDVVRTLHEKSPPWKRHDSNTYSGIPHSFILGHSLCTSVENRSIAAGNSSAAAADPNVDSDSDEDDGGVSL